MQIRTMQVGPIQTNCYLLCDEETRTCAVIDPGGEAGRVAAAAEGGYTPCAILLTHGHYDHTGGVAGLREQFPGVPVYCSRKDQYPAEDRRLARLFPLLEDLTDYGEGDTVQVGSLTVSVLETPGHSEGSVTLRCGDVLFCGDTLFAGSCGRTDLETGDQEKMDRSLARLGALEGEFQVLPGHMGASLLSREREYNPFLRCAMGR